MTLHERFNSIDITKGIIVLSIIFLNNFLPGHLPLWFEGKDNPVLVIIAAGILFPAFIFMTGVTIPFSVSKRINENLTPYEISRHIFARTLILITAGVLLVNSVRVNTQETGFSGYFWSLMLISAIFLVWNRYIESDDRFFTISGLRLLGLAILVFLVFKFRSGTFENNGSLIPGWWEMPGLAGWAYLVGSFTWLAARNSITGTLLIWLFFLALNILDNLGFSAFMDPVKPYFGTLTGGFIPFIVLSGQLCGILLKKFSITDIRKPVMIMTSAAVITGITGYMLATHIFNKGIYGNPGWALTGISVTTLFFALILWLDEVMKVMSWSKFLRSAGSNMMMIYILPFFFYNLIWLTGINLFFYNTGAPVIAITGSVIWTTLMLWISLFLVRMNIRLKF